MSQMRNCTRRLSIALCTVVIALPHSAAFAQTANLVPEALPAVEEGSSAEPVAFVQDEELSPAEEIIDFQLDDGGLFSGEVRNHAGKLLPGKTVRVLFEGTELATAQTDAGGMFRVSGLREGLHDVEVCDSTKRYQLWAEESAPPESEQCARLVCSEEVVAAPRPVRQVARPRRFGRLASAFATYPLATTALVGAGIGAAIAIPIATAGGGTPASP